MSEENYAMSDPLAFLKVDYENAPDVVLIPQGKEVYVEIGNVDVSAEKFYANVVLNVIEGGTGRPLRHMLFFPRPGDEEDRIAERLRSVKKFFEAFRISKQESADPALWKEKRSWAVVGIEDKPPFEARNTIKYFVGDR